MYNIFFLPILADPSCLNPLYRMTCGSKNETSYSYSQGHWLTAPSCASHLLPCFLWFNGSWLVGGKNGCPFRLSVPLHLFLYFILMLLLSFILLFPGCIHVSVHYYLWLLVMQAHICSRHPHLSSEKWCLTANTKRFITIDFKTAWQWWPWVNPGQLHHLCVFVSVILKFNMYWSDFLEGFDESSFKDESCFTCALLCCTL